MSRQSTFSVLRPRGDDILWLRELVSSSEDERASRVLEWLDTMVDHCLEEQRVDEILAEYPPGSFTRAQVRRVLHSHRVKNDRGC